MLIGMGVDTGSWLSWCVFVSGRADEGVKHNSVTYHYDQQAGVQRSECQHNLWCYRFVPGLCSGPFDCIIPLPLTLGFALLYVCTSTVSSTQHTTMR